MERPDGALCVSMKAPDEVQQFRNEVIERHRVDWKPLPMNRPGQA